jgi:cell division septation protein DedD
VVATSNSLFRPARSSGYLDRVRTLCALALVLVACSGSDRSNLPATRTASSTPSPRGPDALVLRVARSGGTPRVVGFPNIDSTAWTGTEKTPALDRVLAFDEEDGLLAAVDAHGLPLWIDLRTGTVTQTGRGKLRGLISIDGSTIYGVNADGAVERFTPPGNWTFKPPQPASAVFPQTNGAVLILTGRGPSARLHRMHPPENTLLDTLALPDVTHGTGAPLGDRVYFVSRGRSLTAVRARTLAKGDPITLDHGVTGIATTPSGDRFYIITDSSSELAVLDPIQDRVSATVRLPGRPRDLRVDPFGRFVLVRAAAGDSVWIVSIGTDKVVGTLHSTWRGDLPFVAPDGSIAVTDGADVAFVDPATLLVIRRAVDGSADFWYAFTWTGLRSHAQPVDTNSLLPTNDDTATVTPPPPLRLPPKDTAAPPRLSPAAPADSSKIGFTVSFAVLLNDAKARELAAKIVVDGKAARVVTGINEGTAVYRVVLGPYTTRDEAERVGRASGQTYYVYAGTP